MEQIRLEITQDDINKADRDNHAIHDCLMATAIKRQIGDDKVTCGATFAFIGDGRFREVFNFSRKAREMVSSWHANEPVKPFVTILKRDL